MGSLEGVLGAILGNEGLGSLMADGLLPASPRFGSDEHHGALAALGELVNIGFGSIDSFSAAPTP
ncbi:hypothetical protein GS901_05960 [Rhodococcus hoagii]|nr:hypothetical protein [Prescottella equi]